MHLILLAALAVNILAATWTVALFLRRRTWQVLLITAAILLLGGHSVTNLLDTAGETIVRAGTVADLFVLGASIVALVFVFGLEGLIEEEVQLPPDWEDVHTRTRTVVQLGGAISAGIVIVCGVVGFFAYQSSRDAIYRSTKRTNTALARSVAETARANMPADVDPAVQRKVALAALDNAWDLTYPQYPGSYVCVIEQPGFLTYHSGRPDLIGLDVHGIGLNPIEEDDPKTVSDLLSKRGDWSGINTNARGDEQIVAYHYFEPLDGLVVVHTPTHLVTEDVQAAVRPWVLGLGLMGVVLVPLSTFLLFRMFFYASRSAGIAATALQARESEFRTIAEASPSVIFRADRNGHATYCNAHWATITGREKDAWRGFGWAEAIHPDDRERVLETWMKSVGLDESWTEEMRFRHADEHDVWVLARAVPDGDGFIGICTDITKRKEAEAALQATRDQLERRVDERTSQLDFQFRRQAAIAQLELAVSGSSELRQVLDRIVETVTTLLPAPAGASVILWDEESHRFTVSSSTVPAQPRQAAAKRVRREGGATEWIVKNRQPLIVSSVNDDPFGANSMLMEYEIASYVGVPLIEDYRTIGVLYAMDHSPRAYEQEDIDFLTTLASRAALAIVRSKLYEDLRDANELLEQRVARRTADLESANHELRGEIEERHRSERERNRLERDLQQARRLEAVGTLAAGVAHDVNNALTAILGYASIAEQDIPEDHEATEAIQGVILASHQAAAITKALLTFSRQVDSEIKPVNLHDVLHHASRIYRPLISDSIEVEVEADPQIPIWIEGSPSQLEQVIVNLAINSRDALPNGGRIGIRLAKMSGRGPDEPRIAVIEVEDNGEGMPHEVQDRIFEPFFSTKTRAQGTGLGMSIVHGTVTEHGGQIEVDSKPGRGTRIRIEIPCCDPPSTNDNGLAEDANSNADMNGGDEPERDDQSPQAQNSDDAASDSSHSAVQAD